MDLKYFFSVVWSNRRTFFIALPIIFVLSAVYIFFQPRYYKTTVSLAPETEGVGSGISSLASLAGSFGFNLGGIENGDAISPELYPDVFMSNDFLVGLLGVPVETEEGDVKADYYTYLRKHQKSAPWSPAIRAIKRAMMPKKKSSPQIGGDGKEVINPFCLTEEQFATLELIKSNIVCAVDKNTGVITLTVKDQDRKVCAQMGDAAMRLLQDFIVSYRTNKAHANVLYYEGLEKEAQKEYEDAVAAYARYADSHQNTILQSAISQRDALENDMQMKLTTLTAIQQQRQNAQARERESTPVFTTLERASMPVKPAGPKRMFFVLFCQIIGFAFVYLWLIRKDIFARYLKEEKKLNNE